MGESGNPGMVTFNFFRQYPNLFGDVVICRVIMVLLWVRFLGII